MKFSLCLLKSSEFSFLLFGRTAAALLLQHEKTDPQRYSFETSIPYKADVYSDLCGAASYEVLRGRCF